MNPVEISVISFNVNYSRRAEGPEYGIYSWDNRKDAIFKLIQGANSKVALLQEILTVNQAEVVKNLSDYNWHFEQTNSRDGVCCNGIGIRKDFMPDVAQEKFSFNFNAIEKTAEKVMGLIIGDLCFLNVHCSMDKPARMAMANLNLCLPANKRVLIAGDFNSFADDDGAEQMLKVQKATNTECISHEAISKATGKIALKSFKAYPYDKIPEASLHMPGKLDHIFVKGLSLAPNAKTYVHDDVTIEGTAIHPSDHFALTTTVVLAKT